MKMNSSDFIIESLKKISNSINGINMRYAYDSITEFHIIEVSPESIRRGSEEYAKLESKLWSEFYEQYPEEDILISEISNVNNMNNILFEVQSFRNVSTSSYNFQKVYSDLPLNNICDITYNFIAA